MLEERARHCYEAYCRAAGQQKPTTAYESLPESWKGVWREAATAAVRHWFETDFKIALLDDDRVLRDAASLMKVAREKGDSPLGCVRVGVGGFVLALVRPDVFTEEGA